MHHPEFLLGNQLPVLWQGPLNSFFSVTSLQTIAVMKHECEKFLGPCLYDDGLPRTQINVTILKLKRSVSGEVYRLGISIRVYDFNLS